MQECRANFYDALSLPLARIGRVIRDGNIRETRVARARRVDTPLSHVRPTIIRARLCFRLESGERLIEASVRGSRRPALSKIRHTARS